MSNPNQNPASNSAIYQGKGSITVRKSDGSTQTITDWESGGTTYEDESYPVPKLQPDALSDDNIAGGEW